MTKDRYNRDVKIGDHIVWTYARLSTYGGKVVGFTKEGLPLVLGYNYEMDRWNESTWCVRTKLFVKVKSII